MKRFAFGISVPDMIRKARYRYEQPIDYLDEFVSRAYTPNQRMDITVTEDSISLRTEQPLPQELLERAATKDLLSIVAILPPIEAYKRVTIESGTIQLLIDEHRHVTTVTREPMAGALCTIMREATNIERECYRIQQLYSGSDLTMFLNDERFGEISREMWPFNVAECKGVIGYDPCSQGGIDFFTNGRFTGTRELSEGLNVILYQHPMRTLITKSDVITAGDNRYEAFLTALPQLFAQYLNSEPVTKLRENATNSYQRLLRSVLKAYPDEEVVRKHIEERIKPLRGEINPLQAYDNPLFRAQRHKADEVQTLLGLRRVRITSYPGYRYDASMELLCVNGHDLAAATSLDIALRAVPHIEADPRKQCKLYRQAIECVPPA